MDRYKPFTLLKSQSTKVLLSDKIRSFAFIACLIYSVKVIGQGEVVKPYQDTFRPQVHFSPKQHWMNDPNGMVYFNHTYHLFFQYYPGGTVWGPMHWGHAISKDLIHWKELPIALYPDSLGYIFSGSAVVDSNNTSGFGKNGKIPLVAIFTHHDPKGEKDGKDNFQNESLAYSLDNGGTWAKYGGNPVLKNPGIKDFRDPKVMWYANEKKWVMTLATKNRITFYSSPDLKNWKKESEFGGQIGAHGGVWECPDIFPLELKGKTYWVLIVNLNPGGPNGGSATQYFIGQFNGNKFTPTDTSTKWLDYGPDEYAGITWGNTGSRKIFLGWMSNWLYANQVPTKEWRNAMTIPRELKLATYKNSIVIISQPVKEIDNLNENTISLNNINIQKGFDLFSRTGKVAGQYILKLNANEIKSYSIVLSNNKNERVIIGYDKTVRQYYIDRSQSGNVDFNKDFGRKYTAPRLSDNKDTQLTLVVDASSVELFADGGSTVMTGVFFPGKSFNKIYIQSGDGFVIKKLTYSPLKSIWQK
jgi:fructan beta-fructosidase